MGAAIVSAGGRQHRILVAAIGVNEILASLRSIPKASKELSAVIGSVKGLFDRQAETGTEPTPEELRGVLKSLQSLKEQPPAVAKSIKMLKGILGLDKAEVAGAPPAPGKMPADLAGFMAMLSAPPPGGNIPAFSQGKITASIKPNVYRARLIKAGRALDGTIWTEEALKGAVSAGLFEGRAVKVMTFNGKYGEIENHLPDEVVTGSIFGNQVGFVKGATWDPVERAVYASVWITDPARAALINSMLDQGVELPGMSIYATGQKLDDNRVTTISEIDSMDLVTFPAAEGRILAMALTASVKLMNILKAADPDQPLPPQIAPDETDNQAPAPEPAVATGFGRDWLAEQATRFSQDILAGQPEPPDLQQKVDKIISGLESMEYDQAEYPINIVVVLLNRIYNAINAKKAPEQPKPQEAEPKQAAAPQAPAQEPASAGAVAKQQAIGGAVKMDQAVARKIGTAIDGVNSRLSQIEQRVNTVDTESMVADRLMASPLPDVMKLEMAKQLKGVAVTPSELDSFIAMQSRVVAGMQGTLARRASVDVEGNPVGAGPDTVEAAFADLLNVKRG
jgi:hypothetical protein